MSRQEGFTLLEFIFGLAVMGILAAAAMPSIVSWRENATYRKTAREITSALHEARSRAIQTNLEHRLEVDLEGKCFRMVRGNRAEGSTASSWEQNIIYDWVGLPSGPILRATSNCSQDDETVKFHFNPSGTANRYYLCILDRSGENRYQVGVPYAATGRVVIRKWQPGLDQWQ
jgi:type II secretion system protein H